MDEKKYEGILICSDFDGTLAYQNKISDENCQAIRHFMENGGLFTIVSGRHPKFFNEYANLFVPNTYICGMNGTIIEAPDSHHRIYDAPMGKDVFLFVRQIIDEIPEAEMVQFQSAESSITFKREQGGPIFKTTDISFNEADIPEYIYKVLFVVPDDASDAVLKRVSMLCGQKYTVSRSWLNGIEIQRRGEDKGHAVNVLRKYLAESVHTIIGVGDYENDLPLLREADIAVAVEDAIDEVKGVSDYIVPNCSKDSLAQVIYEIADKLNK